MGQLPPDVRRKVERYTRARVRAQAETARSIEAGREAARALVRAGVSLRDAGEILGVSYERVRQLAEGT